MHKINYVKVLIYPIKIIQILNTKLIFYPNVEEAFKNNSYSIPDAINASLHLELFDDNYEAIIIKQ